MKIVSVTRCYNESPDIIHRFIKGYWFSDRIIISDGGSTRSETLTTLLDYQSMFPEKIDILHFKNQTEINDEKWNPDNPHIQFVIDAGKETGFDWIILDDMDDVPNKALREDARMVIENSPLPQINAFRLYMWGDKEFFPNLNGHFEKDWKSLWAWKPSEVNIYTDMSQHHGTILGIRGDYHGLELPYCLLHKSWHPDTIQAKIDRYNKIGIAMSHPLHFAGPPQPLPDYAYE